MASKHKGEVMALFSVYGEDDEEMDEAEEARVEEEEDHAQEGAEGEIREQPASVMFPSEDTAGEMEEMELDAGKDNYFQTHRSPQAGGPSTILSPSSRTTPTGATDQSGERVPPSGTPESMGHSEIATTNGHVDARDEREAGVGMGPVQEKDEREEERNENLRKFLPSPPRDPCSEHLQMRFARYLELKQRGVSLNDTLRKSKGYRNPVFMQQVVEHEGIDEHGSCFEKSVFDPHGLPPEDFCDSLVLEQRKEAEKRDTERKQKGQVEFLKGGVQMPPKPVVQIVGGVKGAQAGSGKGVVGGAPLPVASGVSSAAALATAPVPLGTAALAAAASALAGGGKLLDGRSGKKSKWDKVSPEPSGGGSSGSASGVGRGAHLAIAAVRAHAAAISGAALLSSSAISQQRGKEDRQQGGNKR